MQNFYVDITEEGEFEIKAATMIRKYVTYDIFQALTNAISFMRIRKDAFFASSCNPERTGGVLMIVKFFQTVTSEFKNHGFFTEDFILPSKTEELINRFTEKCEKKQIIPVPFNELQVGGGFVIRFESLMGSIISSLEDDIRELDHVGYGKSYYGWTFSDFTDAFDEFILSHRNLKEQEFDSLSETERIEFVAALNDLLEGPMNVGNYKSAHYFNLFYVRERIEVEMTILRKLIPFLPDSFREKLEELERSLEEFNSKQDRSKAFDELASEQLSRFTEGMRIFRQVEKYRYRSGKKAYWDPLMQ